jgi:hypothetical protein
MPYDRDVQAFDDRAATYESGYLGRLHHEISGRVADLALRQVPAPRRILDVGSGTDTTLAPAVRRTYPGGHRRQVAARLAV